MVRGLDRDGLSRLVLSHPGDVDRWAGEIVRARALPRSWGRLLARMVAVEGDSPATRLLVWDSISTLSTPHAGVDTLRLSPESTDCL